jgi:hypothetical protein
MKSIYKYSDLENQIFDYWFATGVRYEDLRKKFTPSIKTIDHIKKIIDRKLKERQKS